MIITRGNKVLLRGAKLLTREVADVGPLYDGLMTVGIEVLGLDFGILVGFRDGIGELNPTVADWTNCSVIFFIAFNSYSFESNLPGVGNQITHYEFGGQVFTDPQALWNYLDSEVGNQITLRVFEDPQA